MTAAHRLAMLTTAAACAITLAAAAPALATPSPDPVPSAADPVVATSAAATRAATESDHGGTPRAAVPLPAPAARSEAAPQAVAEPVLVAAPPAVGAPDGGAAPRAAVVPPAGPGASGGRAGQGGITAGDLFGTYQAAVDGLRAFGMQPFLYPTAAPFCLEGTTLGLAPAVAGAVPGPWPKTAITLPGIDMSAVKAGQTMFTFLPYGLGRDSVNTSGMRVAWFNVTTGRGGMASMGSLSDVFRAMVPPEVPPALRPLAERAVQDFFVAALPVGGIRAVPVDTGSGTVLAAVFGTVENGTDSCFFLPTVGITEVP